MELNISDLIFAAINFLVMVGILSYLLFKPVIKILDNRKAKIHAEIEQAQTLQADAMALKQQCEQELMQARQQAIKLIQDATEQGESKKKNLLEQAQKDTELTYKKMQLDLKREKEKMREGLKSEVVMLATNIARKILTTTVSISSANRIEEFISQAAGSDSMQQMREKVVQLGARVSAEIVTFQPLSDAERALINQLLNDVGAPNAILMESVSDELLGGCVLFIGDLMMDASVSNMLQKIGNEALAT